MPGVRVTGFRGKAPKVSPELLPDQAGQIARNCKLYSGDIIPFPEPRVVGSTGRTGQTQTIYPLRNPTTNALEWLSWSGEVNIARPSYFDYDDEQRFYYTGDGKPKVSTYNLAMSGSAPYPNDYYELGLPLPATKLAPVATEYTAVSISSFARSAGGVVTIETGSAHNLRTGLAVTISGFTYLTGTYSRSGTTVTVTITGHGIADGAVLYLTGLSGDMTDGAYTINVTGTDTFEYSESISGATSGDIRVDIQGFNTPSSPVTVVDSTTFQYFSPGFQISERATTEGAVDLSGAPSIRTYVYTWYTPWGEESVASEPSENIVVREGQSIAVGGIPTSRPAGKNFIRGVRLYRILSSVTVAEYRLLKTLWFPQNTATMSRAGNVTTVETADPHNLLEGDRFKITNCTDTSFNATDAKVVDIVDQYTFTFNQAGVDTAEFADTTAVLYHDAAQKLTDTARYWGESGFSFTDDFDPNLLFTSLRTDEYDPPPEDLQGLKTIQNNILCGFVGKELYFSEADNPHAWPEEYITTLDYNIVAVEPLSGVGVLVLTEGYPFLLSGSSPGSFSVQRIDALYPCLTARGVVSMSYGVVWPTSIGLASYSASGGARIVTDALYEHDTWNEEFELDEFVAVFYEDSYFASHSGGSIIFKYNQENGGNFVNCDAMFTAMYNDPSDHGTYFVDSVTDDVYLWDDPDQPAQAAEWKSKVITLREYMNFGAARVVADYEDTNPVWENWNIPWADADDATWDATSSLTFKLWVDKELVCSYTISSKQPFRLPTGYRSDTFEFGITSNVRVRAVHLAETVYGLKEA